VSFLRRVGLPFRHPPDNRAVEDELRRILAGIRGKVADDVFQKVGSICYRIVNTLTTEGGAGDPLDPNANLIRQTALSYLPDALRAYLAIPRPYAEARLVESGKTAHDILMDQLNLMDSKLSEVADAIARNDTERLLSSVRFLQERFASSSLNVSGGQSVVADPDGPTVV
jgi:hypothetical protein